MAKECPDCQQTPCMGGKGPGSFSRLQASASVFRNPHRWEKKIPVFLQRIRMQIKNRKMRSSATDRLLYEAENLT